MIGLDTLLQLLADTATHPGVIVACGLAIFIAGIVAGIKARDMRWHAYEESDAGDTHAHLPPLPTMRTANRAQIERQSADLQHLASQRPRLRAVGSPLKPSYPPQRAEDKSPRA